MTTSFPYLTVAREHGMDYGKVLAFAEMLDRMGGKPQGWEMRDPWERETVRAWAAEQDRRSGK